MVVDNVGYQHKISPMVSLAEYGNSRQFVSCLYAFPSPRVNPTISTATVTWFDKLRVHRWGLSNHPSGKRVTLRSEWWTRRFTAACGGIPGIGSCFGSGQSTMTPTRVHKY